MPRTFALPDLGEGLTEAEVVQVLVAEGQTVAEDTPLLEVETDKARVEIPSPFAGRIEKVHVGPGQSVQVGAPLITFADAGAASPATEDAAGAGSPAPAGAAAGAPSGRAAPPEREDAAERQAASGGSRAAPPLGARAAAAGAHADRGPVPATPATRRLARELEVDLRGVAGTGPGGRVTDDDVRAAARPLDAAGEAGRPGAGPPAAPTAGQARPLARVGVEPPPLPRFEQWGPVERRPLSHLRRTIAERMALSATVIPHVSHLDRADITDLDLLIRRSLEAGRARGIALTLTSFLLKAAALALAEHPQFNASLDAAAGELIVKRYCHLGIAVATDRGLIVPVLRDVDRKPVLDLARELAALAERIRAGRATLDDLRGGTFTITNLGALGGTGAIPIINHPEVAILGVARAREEAVVRGGGIVPRLLLPLTLTFDHRVADGADGARFAASVIRRLEAPEQLLWDW